MTSFLSIRLLISSLLMFSFITFCFSQIKYNNDSSILKDPSGYKVRSGDRVRITIRGEEEASVESIIDNDGKIRPAYLGEFKISGYSTKQIEKLLVAEYQRQLIYKRPNIVVNILNYSDRVVFLTGSLNKQGPYVFPPEVEAMNIVEVIARAGGFNDIAKKDRVFVTRTFYDEQGKIKDTKTYTVDVQALSTGNLYSGSKKQFWIYPGDRIEVQERLI